MKFKERVFNFSAGPAALPLPVLKQAQEEMLNWQGTGCSVMELSHRSQHFEDLKERVIDNTRYLLNIPPEFSVLLLQDGARGQFAAMPLNLLGKKTSANYCVTGFWSQAAALEAEKFCKVNICHNEKAEILPQNLWGIDNEGAYLHYCDNESISGVEFKHVPKADAMPSVSDMTSNLFTRQLDLENLDAFYASAQKNFGIAGVCLVVVRKSLLQQAKPNTPSVHNYTIQAEKDSMFNTPATFSWYMMDLYLQWLKEQGGVSAMQKKARDRSERLYALIDHDDFYTCEIKPEFRSRINIRFNLPNIELEQKFLQEAAKQKLVNLKGHKSLGGVRACFYNAIEDEAVDCLLSFMQEFRQKS